MYLMQERMAEEISADDPFGGRGFFLPFKAPAEDILGALERFLGYTVPAVAWPWLGVWVDGSGVRGPASQVLSGWDSGGGL